MTPHTLSSIAAVYGELDDSKAVLDSLKDSLTAAKEIKDSFSRNNALINIVAAYGKLGNSKAALEGLKASLSVAKEIKDPFEFPIIGKGRVLSAIAAAAGDITNPNMRQSILEDTLTVAEAANAGGALAEISYQYAQDGAWGKALHALRRCPDAEKVPALAKILTLWVEKQNPQLQ